MTARATVRPKIAILLCTHNGEDFLEEQLESYDAQTWGDWILIASDDNSTDSTREILARYQQRWGEHKLTIICGPARGYAANFAWVTHYARGLADYYAWSDQDDIWYPDKLERALQLMSEIPDDVPGLYCGRTLLVSTDNQEITLTMLATKPPCFANALIQNIGGGNTMVFNQAACSLLAETTREIQLVSHDWWAYMIVTGCGGRVVYDPTPGVRYRQHDGNLIGENLSLPARLFRIRQLFKGRFRQWNAVHMQALLVHRDRLTKENRRIFELFAKARECWVPVNLLLLRRSRVHRQTRMSTLGLYLAALFRKI